MIHPKNITDRRTVSLAAIAAMTAASRFWLRCRFVRLRGVCPMDLKAPTLSFWTGSLPRARPIGLCFLRTDRCIPHWCPTDTPARFTRFLAKATITLQAPGRRGTIGEFAKPAKMKARCRWRRKVGAAEDFWGKSRPRKTLTRSGTCRGTRGSG